MDVRGASMPDNPDGFFKPEDWIHAGGNPQRQVPMAVRWLTEPEEAFEFTSLDGSYNADLDHWNEYLAQHGSKMEAAVGPVPKASDATGATQVWFRVTGPAARTMYDASQEAKDEQSVEATEASGTIWSYKNGKFRFRPFDGRPLTPIEQARWRQACREKHSDFKAVPDRVRGGELYVIKGEFAQHLAAAADEDPLARDLDSVTNFRAIIGQAGLRDRSDRNGDVAIGHFLNIEAARAFPVWEGARTFTNCLKSTDYMLDHYSRRDYMTGAMGVAHDARSALVACHPILVDPEQVKVLPVPSLAEAAEVLQRSELPFDPVFLDVSSGPRAEDMSWIEGDTVFGPGKLGSAGTAIGSDVNGDRFAIPFGATLLPDDRGRAIRYFRESGLMPAADKDAILKGAIDADTYGKEWGMSLSDAANNGIPSHGPIATIVAMKPSSDGVMPPFPMGYRLTDEGGLVSVEDFHEGKVDPDGVCLAFVLASVHGGPETLAAMLAIPDALAYRNIDLDNHRKRLAGWAACAFQQFRLAMGVLQFLQNYNVEIVDAQVSRQVRRKAERKGTPLSKTVYIRHRISRSSNGHEHDPDAERVVGNDYRYEVIGHTRHFTKGPHVWCKNCKGTGELEGPVLPNGRQDNETCPDCDGLGLDRSKLTPCTRRDDHGELTCPHGCRKEWVPPFVKGAEDAPLIPKTRKTIGGN